MTKRPQLKAAVSKKEFRDTIAEMASEFARHIELSVEAFAPDQAARKERLRRVAEADGFQFFMETYLPHYGITCRAICGSAALCRRRSSMTGVRS